MSLFFIALRQIVILFLILIVGYIFRKTGMIGGGAKKELTSILINVIMPFVILNSFLSEEGSEFAALIPKIALLLFIVYAVSIAYAHLIIRKKSPDLPLYRLGIIFSNTGFLGIPLLKALYGSLGEFCAIMAMIAFNMVFWCYSGMVLSEAPDLKSSIKKGISAPFVAVVIALLLLAFSIKLPSVVMEPISLIASMNSPLAMLVTGVTIAESDLSRLFSPNVISASIHKNILIPVLLTVIFFALSFFDETAVAILVTAACPTGALVPAVAIQYNKPTEFPSGLFTFSTVLSMLSLPAFVYILNILASR